MEANTRTAILCVDDEQSVLDGLVLHLRRRYDITTATSGRDALEILLRNRSLAVILSDLRMPGMDGATFLSRAREIAPDAVRVLLTGRADVDSSIAAVNEGQIFRFLTKPCPPPALAAAIDAAAEQHRLITAERVLLEQTLHGSVKALTDVLALTNPESFGRATRVRKHVTDLSLALGMTKRWEVEVAAMLSQLGTITLPTETAEKIHYGKTLSPEEQEMAARVPEVTERLLSSIPRLEVVRGILATYSKPFRRTNTGRADAEKDAVVRFAQILKIALDFDALEASGDTASRAIDTMRSRADRYDPEVLTAFATLFGGEAREDIREVPISLLRVGMVFAEDARMSNGALLVARGYEVTASFVERLRNYRPGTVKEPVRVVVRDDAKEG